MGKTYRRDSEFRKNSKSSSKKENKNKKQKFSDSDSKKKTFDSTDETENAY
jgi:hypothetical protein